MMRTKLLSAFLIVGAATASQVAFAVDGTITFTGKVTAQTCTISGGTGTSADFTVTLPTVAASALSTAGATALNVPFRIALSDCTPAAGATVHAYFEPSSFIDSTTNNVKPDETVAGFATNVQIRLLNQQGEQILLGKADADQNSPTVTLRDGKGTLNFAAQYYATGAATAGTVNTKLQYTLIYN